MSEEIETQTYLLQIPDDATHIIMSKSYATFEQVDLKELKFAPTPGAEPL
jgi:hypothetical protein